MNKSSNAISTGIKELDSALGAGLPRGHLIELCGPTASGKSAIAMRMASAAQRDGNRVAVIDMAHLFDENTASRASVSMTDVPIAQPNSGEEAFETIELLLSRNCDLIVVESSEFLRHSATVVGDTGELVTGYNARFMAKSLRRLSALVTGTKTAIVFVNTRHQNSDHVGDTTVSSGDTALKFYCSVRMTVRRAMDDEDNEVVRVSVVKNKTAAPFQDARVDFSTISRTMNL